MAKGGGDDGGDGGGAGEVNRRHVGAGLMINGWVLGDRRGIVIVLVVARWRNLNVLMICWTSQKVNQVYVQYAISNGVQLYLSCGRNGFGCSVSVPGTIIDTTSYRVCSKGKY